MYTFPHLIFAAWRFCNEARKRVFNFRAFNFRRPSNWRKFLTAKISRSTVRAVLHYACAMQRKYDVMRFTLHLALGLGRLCSIFFTHYAIPICSKLYQLCLKLCPKFAYYAQTMPIISGRSKLVCSNNYFTLHRKSKLKQDNTSSTIEL